MFYGKIWDGLIFSKNDMIILSHFREREAANVEKRPKRPKMCNLFAL